MLLTSFMFTKHGTRKSTCLCDFRSNCSSVLLLGILRYFKAVPIQRKLLISTRMHLIVGFDWFYLAKCIMQCCWELLTPSILLPFIVNTYFLEKKKNTNKHDFLISYFLLRKLRQSTWQMRSILIVQNNVEAWNLLWKAFCFFAFLTDQGNWRKTQ